MLMASLVGMPDGTAPGEDTTEVPQQLNLELPCDPAIPFLGRYTKGLKEAL